MTKKDRNPDDLKISDNLIKNITHLVKESGLSQVHIAQLANIPPTTVNGMILGNSINPKIYTLASISRVFNKSIGQLLGELPLNFAVIAIPILSWDKLDIQNKRINHQTNQDTNFISTNIVTKNKICAISVDSRVSSLYQKNTLIVVEESSDFDNLDLVILSINNSEPTIKKVLKEGDDIFLESVSHNIPTATYEKHITHIFGIIRETRF